MLKHLTAAAVLASAALLSSAAPIPSGASLSISAAPSDIEGFDDVTVSVTGSLPGAPVMLLVGPREGDTTIGTPLGELSLGLDHPFALQPLGQANEDGNITVIFLIPSRLEGDFFGQSVSAELVRGEGRPSFEFCTSNVASVSL